LKYGRGKTMAKGKRVRPRDISSILTLILIVFIILLTHYYHTNSIGSSNLIGNEIKEALANYISLGKTQEKVDLNNAKLNLIYFYVGQGDSTFIELNNTTMLIDAGNNGDGYNIAKYLQSIGIDHIDYLIGSHSDEDHIGGLEEIINKMNVSNLFIPTVGSGKIDYENAISKAKLKGVNIVHPKEGDEIVFDNAKCIIKSAENYEAISTNNSSIVNQINFGDTKFLFMGDAEKEVEETHTWDDIDVLKVGHHGSNTSSSAGFLDQTTPYYAIVQVGKDNDYRLPNKYVLQRLNKINANILRTDINCSSFWITSDGKNITEAEIEVNLDSNED
jgi:competence protein ComEC